MADLDFQELWDNAIDYDDFVAQSHENCSLWVGKYKTARIPDWAFEKACEHGPPVRILAIVEDWCGDASNTVPVLARMGHEAQCLEMRVLLRDENPDVMDQYLTNGSRSIPIVIVLDSEFNEKGHWGPRPGELQQWVMDNKDTMPTDERYKHVRTWYARDKGETTLREILSLLEK